MSDRHKSLIEIGSGSLCVIGSFMERNDLLAASLLNHEYYDLLLQARVTQRISRDVEFVSLDAEFYASNRQAVRLYFTQVESFAYQFQCGQLLHDPEDDLESHLLRGPVLQHLMTLCGTDAQLARNVVRNYRYLYEATSILGDGEGWLIDESGLRYDDSELYDRGPHSDNGCWRYFDAIFDKDDFPGMSASVYRQYLIENCVPVFRRLQENLSLRMRSQYGTCELGECGCLLESMHMTRTIAEFIEYVQFLFKTAVKRKQREEHEDDCVDDDFSREVPFAIQSCWWNHYPATINVRVEDIVAHNEMLYNDITPTGIYFRNGDFTYVDEYPEQFQPRANGHPEELITINQTPQ